MNRYLIVGVLRDMRAGRRVLVVSGTRPEVRAALDDVTAHLRPEDAQRVRVANGAESIEARGGGAVRFVSRTGLRGASADVVVVEGHQPTLDEREDLAVLALTGAEVLL